MAGCAARWLAVAAALCACDGALGDFVTWPGCPKQLYKTDRVVTPGVADHKAIFLLLESCNLTSSILEKKLDYPNIIWLILKRNKLNSLPSGIFDSLVSLLDLHLEYTSLSGKDLESNMLRKCTGLRDINFSGNNMTEAPADLLQGLDRLEWLYCRNCSLHQMPSFITHPVLPNMRYTILENNQLSGLSARTFSNVANLEKLDLTYNKIDYLHEDLFKNLTKIKWIYMDSNKIRYIPEQLFQNKSSLQYLYLSNNLIDYIPARAFIGATGLRELYLHNNRLSYLPDLFFTSVVPSSGWLYFTFQGNPWPCACLNKVLFEVKKLNIVYDSSKYDGKHKNCIMNDNFKCEPVIDLFQKLIGHE